MQGAKSRRYGAGVRLESPAFIHETALIYGKVLIREGTSLWPYTVIRAESASVEIGRFTNVQDFVMIHTSPGLPVVIGENCSITHHATVHGAKIGDNTLIGINATLYDGVEIGANCIVGQHSYVKDGTIVPDNSIVVGSPARVIKTVDASRMNMFNARLYHRNALAYDHGDHRAWSGKEFESFVERTMVEIEEELKKRADTGAEHESDST